VKRIAVSVVLHEYLSDLIHVSRVECKWFYLLLESIAVRTLVQSLLNIMALTSRNLLSIHHQ